MRKIIIITAIIILALLLTGCGNGNMPSINGTDAQAAKPAGKDANQPNTKDPAAKSANNSASNQTTGGTEIVAKSENIMSSSDKEELLNQVDKELDSLFNNINNLDDAQDTDLDLNQK
ncbi:MAG: hypothetical protein P4L69_23815 [Desulfosporosinus sp.]|nr:hypothetical protein [Desulfosporosinus sp.]